jgi:hypothetical protein
VPFPKLQHLTDAFGKQADQKSNGTLKSAPTGTPCTSAADVEDLIGAVAASLKMLAECRGNNTVGRSSPSGNSIV